MGEDLPPGGVGSGGDSARFTAALSSLLAARLTVLHNGRTPGDALFTAMRSLVVRRLASAAGWYLLNVAATLVTPVAIFALLTWVDDTGDPAPGLGVGYVAALAAASVTAFVAEERFDRAAKAAGVECRAGALGLVYRRVLAARMVDVAAAAAGGGPDGGGISDSDGGGGGGGGGSRGSSGGSGGGGGGGGDAGSGELHNLFSVDSAAVLHLWSGALTMVLQPAEILAIVGMLYAYVDVAAFGGVGVVLVALAVAHAGGTRVERLAAARSAATDVRIRDLNEALLGMKVVKLNGWEARFAALIAATRARESALTRAQGWSFAAVNTASSNSVDVISFAVIVIFTLALGRRLDAPTTFTYWVLLGILHGRIFHFPVALRHVKEGAAAVRRLQAFLTRPVTPDCRRVVVGGAPGRGAAVDVAGADFAWAPPGSAAPPLLTRVTLSVAPGQLVGVVGPVGYGKTTLLMALLGEVPPAAGAGGVTVTLPPAAPHGAAPDPDAVAVVPQTAWIITGTMRDNIVFGRAWDAARYASVVAACALDADFSRFPAGDATHVAAFTLSGGQKQRISLARAVYGRAALYILDDCLSALDQRVAAHVTAAVLGPRGLLAGATRILVTNSVAALQACDVIACLTPAAGGGGGGAGAPAPPSPVLAPGGSGSGAPLSARPARRAPRLHGPFTVVAGLSSDMMTHPAFSAAMAAMAVAGSSVDDAADAADCESSAAAAAATAPPPPPPPPAAGGGAGSAVSAGGTALDIAAIESSIMPAMQIRPADPPIGGSGSASSAAHALAVGRGSGGGSGDGDPTPTTPQPSGGRLGLPFFSSWVLGAGGPWFSLGVTFWLLSEAAFVEASVFVLAAWSDDAAGNDPTAPDRRQFYTYLALYGGAIVFELISAYIRQHVYSAGTVAAADKLHRALLFRLTHAPQSFFDGASLGGVLNWFARDLAAIDTDTFYASEYFWLGVVYGVLVLIVELVVTPWVLVPFAPVAALLWLVLRTPSRRGRTTAATGDGHHSAPADAVKDAALVPAPRTWASAVTRALDAVRPPDVGDRIAAETRAKVPFVDHFAATLDGLVSVRAFAAGGRFMDAHHALSDAHGACLAAVSAAQATQILVSNIIGALYYIGSSAVIVPVRLAGGLSAGDAGFIVVNSCFSSYMATMVSTNRATLTALALTRGALVRAAFEMPQEASVRDDPDTAAEAAVHDAVLRPYYALMAPAERGAAPLAGVDVGGSGGGGGGGGGGPPPAGWPAAGGLALEGLCLRYRPDAPLVLRGVTLAIPPGTHVGVVGRTGAGKSSLIAAITRLVEPCGGRVVIDGVDAATVPLARLRDGVTVISQDPLFFTGSLRRNLDPFGLYADDDLVASLHAVRLFDFAVAGVPAGASPLDMPITERGANLSIGQQQLLALARALLRRPRLVCLDEATASLDARTEAAVNDTVHAAFAGATVVQVAHRLVSVIGCDTVVVMADGVVAEVGAPADLLAASPPGLFAGMVAAMPAAAAADLAARARDAQTRRRQVGPAGGR
jgi:ABC-type multidrug transport system fused ATPase/permease subunit